MHPLSNVVPQGGEPIPPSVNRTVDAIPEAQSSQIGVSVRYEPTPSKSWYVFRATYGREDKAYEYIVNDGTYAYVAKRYKSVVRNRVREMILEPLMPGFLFVYASKTKAEEYVKNTADLPFLNFYYNHFEQESGKNPPLTVLRHEMENFILATVSQNEHLKVVSESQCHFKTGDKVRVIEGPFKGVEGRVARVSGQQCVVLQLSHIGWVSTAYVPTAFLEKTNKVRP